MSTDPREEHNLINNPAYAERISQLRHCLIDELKDREEGYVQNGKLVPGQKPVVMLQHPKQSN